MEIGGCLTGSWGTLGIIAEVIFKTVPEAESTASIIVYDQGAETDLQLLSRALSSPYEVSGATHLPAGF